MAHSLASIPSTNSAASTSPPARWDMVCRWARAPRWRPVCRVRPAASFVLVSDAECNEGSLWEAVMFAAHHRLANLVAIIDLNGQQALGYTDDVLRLSPMAERWRAFGWDVHEVDGHDVPALSHTIAGLDTTAGPPHVLIARTVFGKGVSYMERQIKWHYLPMSEADYTQALSELEFAG